MYSLLCLFFEAFSFAFDSKKRLCRNRATEVSSGRLGAKWSSNRWCWSEARLKLQEAGKALMLTESPTLYFSYANLQCEGLGADSDPSRITVVM